MGFYSKLLPSFLPFPDATLVKDLFMVRDVVKVISGIRPVARTTIRNHFIFKPLFCFGLMFCVCVIKFYIQRA